MNVADREALINEQISAAQTIKHEFGIEKALGYIVGEKFFNLIQSLHLHHRGDERKAEAVSDFEALIIGFSRKISETFSIEELENYFASNPRFGFLGHTTTEDEHELIVKTGSVERSLDDEVADALVMGEMKRYLNL